MKNKIYLAFAIVMMMSCQQGELPQTPTEECVLEFENVRTSRTSATVVSIDPELAVTVLDSDGKIREYYAPGTVPAKIILEPGTFTVQAYTPNAETWSSANDGRGEPYYYAETIVKMQTDATTRLKMSVPMVNYAVGLQLPEQFTELFSDYTFTISAGNRELDLRNGEKAYFNGANGAFSYSLTATNTDGQTFSTMPAVYTDVQNGKSYQISYSYDYNSLFGIATIQVHDGI